MEKRKAEGRSRPVLPRSGPALPHRSPGASLPPLGLSFPICTQKGPDAASPDVCWSPTQGLGAHLRVGVWVRWAAGAPLSRSVHSAIAEYGANVGKGRRGGMGGQGGGFRLPAPASGREGGHHRERPPSPVAAADPASTVGVGRRPVALGEFSKLPSTCPSWPGHPAGWGRREVRASRGAQGQRNEGVPGRGREGADPGARLEPPGQPGFGVALCDQGPFANCAVWGCPQRLPSPALGTHAPRSQQLMPNLWVPSTT